MIPAGSGQGCFASLFLKAPSASPLSCWGRPTCVPTTQHFASSAPFPGSPTAYTLGYSPLTPQADLGACQLLKLSIVREGSRQNHSVCLHLNTLLACTAPSLTEADLQEQTQQYFASSAPLPVVQQLMSSARLLTLPQAGLSALLLCLQLE